MTGASWSGWSDNNAANSLQRTLRMAPPWQTVFQPGIHFDQLIPDKLYVNGDRSFWTMTLSGSITTSSALTWTEQGVGIEQLVAQRDHCSAGS